MTLYHGLISFHFQEPVTDWTRAVAQLPAGTVVKSVDNIGLLVQAQWIASGIRPFFRKWVDQEPVHHQNYDGADMATKRDRARNYFELFINDPELARLKGLIIGCWNEVYAASHTPAETQDRIEQEQAFSDVWLSQYAARFPGATLALSCPGVGNDIPVEVAAIAHEHGYFMDYHAYIPVRAGSVVAGEWPHYSGRWTEMDKRYVAAGYRVKWLFGEGGPVRQYDNGGLDSDGGWKLPECCNGDPIKYGNIMAYWAQKVQAWNAANGRRAYAVNLFTTKQGGGAGSWTWFQTVQPVMDSMAALSQRYAESTPSPEPTPDPEPQPDPEPTPGNFTELVVVAPAGVNIRTQAGDIVGALPVDTRFVGKLIDGFWYLRGRVSANPELVRVAGEVVTPPPPEPPTPAGPLSGVDVSFWQGEIDWRLMKEKGVKVAGIKVTEGAGHVDARWRDNWQWARAYGIKVFPYHYYRNQVDYRVQAENFTTQAKSVSWDYPLAGDFEDNAPQPGLADDVRLFMEAAGAGIVYTNQAWWNQRIGLQAWAASYLLWVANWEVDEPNLPLGWSDWWGWQWKVTDGAAAWGVQSERLDLDWFRPLPLLTHWPVGSKAISNGGNTWGVPPGHEAVDLAALRGDAVYAAADGLVQRVAYRTDGYGRFVIIGHPWGSTLYAHLTNDSVPFVAGQKVDGGQKIGTVGMTGATSGPHLHFEMKVGETRVDPWPELQAI